MTCIPTWTGFLYLSKVINVYNRKVVGWAFGERMTSDMVILALNMALMTRRPKSVIHHSDQGSQGVFNRSSQHLNQGGVTTTCRVDAEVDGERSDAFARCAVASARSGATVLGVNCDRDDEPESGRSGRRVAGGKHSLVPTSWRHTIVYVET